MAYNGIHDRLRLCRWCADCVPCEGRHQCCGRTRCAHKRVRTRECNRARARDSSLPGMAATGENQASVCHPAEMGRDVCLAPDGRPPYPSLAHRMVRAVITYLVVGLTVAVLLQELTPFPVLSWLGNKARILVGI